MRTALDLFCGAGGAGLGMWRAGVRPVGVDRDPAALAVYAGALGVEVVCGDVRALEPGRVVERGIWLLWASPPCQPWSEGRRNRGGLWGLAVEEGRLLFEPLRWVEALNPAWTVIENVDGMTDRDLAPLVAELEKRYAHVVVWRLWAEHWVAQRRGHVFVVAGPTLPIPPAPPVHRPTFADIADGQDAKPVEPHHLRYMFRRGYATPVVTPSDVLPTVTTRSYAERWTCVVMQDAGYLRYPTFLEALRAQGFPDAHPLRDLAGQSPSVAWRLLGNAVPVPLAEAVVRALLDTDGEDEVNFAKDFLRNSEVSDGRS